MAGEALKDANFEARERLSNDPEEAAKRAALVGDNYDVSGYSDKEISMALRGSSFLDEDYARLTGKGGDPSPEKPGDPEKPGNPGTPGNPPPEVSIPTPVPTPGRPFPGFPGPGKPGSGDQSQNIYQDNDITNTITGDNNEVSNFQDNSIRQSMGSSDYSSRYARGLKDRYVLNLLDR